MNSLAVVSEQFERENIFFSIASMRFSTKSHLNISFTGSGYSPIQSAMNFRRTYALRRCSGVIQLGHGERAALMQAGGELFQTVSHGVRGDGNLPFFGFALLGNEKMFRCDDADVSASGSGCIVVQVSLADFPVLPGHVGRHGRHDYPVFRRYSGYPDGLADVFHGYLQLTGFFRRTVCTPRSGIPCRSAINEKADAQRTSVSQYRTVTRLCFVQEF